MERSRGKRYPVRPDDYQLFEEIGEGVSANVYRALCIPFNETVAIKVLDLEKCNNDFEGIRREVKTMILIDHPNVLRAHCSFATDQSLWVVMPFMAQGSCLHIIKSAYPEGFEELVIITILRDVLRALVYLHTHGHIHRDVKAGNILIDTNGAVKLADFGVSACMFDTGDRQRSRNTFVGTPCWMAPEVMQQLHGYDFKADIWSFGITALELAHGHAPFSKYPPMKVLLMTLQNAPPGLDYERDKKFSKSFKQMVAACLVKDPKKRPTAEKLLKHKVFKTARSNEYLTRTILEGLPPLGDRFRKLKAQEADYLLQNKGAYEEHLSQQEYIRGISGWNFNVEDLRAQAALLDDNMEFSPREDPETNGRSKNGYKDTNMAMEVLNSMTVNHRNALIKDELHEIENFEDSLASFPSRPLQALKGCFDVSEDEANDLKDNVQSTSEHMILQQSSEVEELEHTNDISNDLERTMRKTIVPTHQKYFSGSLLPEQAATQLGIGPGNGNRDGPKNKYPSERSYSGPIPTSQVREPHINASTGIAEETTEGRVVQRKGRFKVTSADAANKASPSTNTVNNLVVGSSAKTTVTSSSVLPMLQFVLQQNASQKDQLAKLMKSVEQTSGYQSESVDVGSSELMQAASVSIREKQLQSYVVQLQQRIGCLTDEVQKLKHTNAQLQRELDAVSGKG